MSDNNSLEIRNIEERELITTVTSYVEKKNELLERVSEVSDWNMFRKRIGPELVDALRMQYKRLKKRGVSRKIQEKDMHRGVESGKVYYLQNIGRFQDGDYLIDILQKKTKRTIEYSRGQEMVARFRDKGWCNYFVRKEPGEVDKLSSEDIVYGLRDADARVVEYTLDQKQNSTILPFWPTIVSFWVCIGAVTEVMYIITAQMLLAIFPYWEAEKVFMGTLTGFAAIDILARGFLIFLVICHRCRGKSHKVLKSIRQQWSDFCMEKFIAMAGSRLKCIFYADSMEEIGTFVSCDLTDFLKNYENVVDCETIDFWFEDFTQDDTYQYIDVRQKVVLTRDQGNKIKRKKQTVRLRFMRSKDGIMSMDFYHDWYVTDVEVCKKWFGIKKV